MRWGILGAAKIAQTNLAPAIQRARGAEFAALATSSEEKAAPFRAMQPGVTLHASYEALLADPGIDAVYIPLPNHLHVEWSLKALAAGKHVLCEKPLALEAAQIDPLIAARDASGLLCAEGFMVCHHPQWHRVRQLLADGAIGRLQHVDAAFAFNNPDPANIRNRPETGGGAMYDIGVYPCATTRYATGAEPVSIRADLRRENGIDIFGRVWADFADFTLSFYCGIRMGARQGMVFHGTEGVIEVPFPFNASVAGPAHLLIKRGYDETRIERYEPVDHYQRMIEAFELSATEGVPFACPLEFSRANQMIIDTILAQ
ncbi:Gfo/Idh/MocA family protein [Pararhodobacter zhoushanensis]|uniref:Gfo/Idh/MocA family oxidoreductase n=1 Tax=Pararhodobacter zhoushanensis TaxID=2479545 RepID=A0ABT3GZ59_9RHOB|nr:Gfo/Idh/MocA family oxidoreductase [Pararhodobacter zhoushanensis]MCW1932809.1 Gfo/Idh/MocA family oxidoreductase [Pararhodobacter zhoushanensis]